MAPATHHPLTTGQSDGMQRGRQDSPGITSLAEADLMGS